MILQKLIQANSRIEYRRAPPEPKGDIPQYNCYGHVWASRRTFIEDGLENETVSLILGDDGYREIPFGTEPIRPGDLAIYLFSGGLILHVGEVVDVDHSGSVSVLSKMGSCMPEIIHDSRDYLEVVYPDGVLKFFTDREATPGPVAGNE